MRTPQRSAGLWLSMWCALQSLGTFVGAQLSENMVISVPSGVAATTEHLTLEETVAITVPEILVTKTIMSPVTITQTIMNLETVTATKAVTQLITDLKTVTSTVAVTSLVTNLKNVTATMPVIQLVTDMKTVTATSVVNQVQMVTVTIPGTFFSASYGRDEQNYNDNADNFCHGDKGYEYHLYDYDETHFCIISNASKHRINTNIPLSAPRNWHTTGKRGLRYVNDGHNNDNDGFADDDNDDDESYLGNVFNFDHDQIGKHYFYDDYHVKTHDYNNHDILDDDKADHNDFNDDLDIDKTNNNNLDDDLDIDETHDHINDDYFDKINNHINDDYLNDDTFKLYECKHSDYPPQHDGNFYRNSEHDLETHINNADDVQYEHGIQCLFGFSIIFISQSNNNATYGARGRTDCRC
ncbi:hypothetical protein MMC26_004313 [Xylographa opegraphella]|nr:hypothetical protein [Xylographa opegraphella]